MRSIRLSLVLLVMAASCAQNPEFIPTTDDSGESDADTDADADTDTDTDQDHDGDGFTVAEGDCDDDDIGVNPARDEDPTDGHDNDCDGRVDEQWAGLSVSRQYIWGNSEIVLIDTVSRITQTIELDEGFAPTELSHGLDGGYVFIHDPDPRTDPLYEEDLYENAALVHVDDSGHCTILAEFTQDETEDAYEAGLAGLDDHPAVRGLITHPDGYYIVARRGSLLRVDPDGTVTPLVDWVYDWGNEDKLPYELYAMDLAYDLLTGEVGIFDFLGGFATWSPDAGLDIQKQADLDDNWKNWDMLLLKSGDAMDAGGWYGLLIDYKTSQFEVVSFDASRRDWATRMEWSEALIQPESLATDGDNGDVFVTANAGWYHMVWLLRESTDLVDDFYKSDSAEGYFFRGVVSNY